MYSWKKCTKDKRRSEYAAACPFDHKELGEETDREAPGRETADGMSLQSGAGTHVRSARVEGGDRQSECDIPRVFNTEHCRSVWKMRMRDADDAQLSVAPQLDEGTLSVRLA